MYREFSCSDGFEGWACVYTALDYTTTPNVIYFHAFTQIPLSWVEDDYDGAVLYTELWGEGNGGREMVWEGNGIRREMVGGKWWGGKWCQEPFSHEEIRYTVKRSRSYAFEI